MTASVVSDVLLLLLQSHIIEIVGWDSTGEPYFRVIDLAALNALIADTEGEQP